MKANCCVCGTEVNKDELDQWDCCCDDCRNFLLSEIKNPVDE